MPLDHDTRAGAADVGTPAAPAPGKRTRSADLARATKPDDPAQPAEAESLPRTPGTNPAPEVVVETHVGGEQHHLMLEVRADGSIDVMMHSYPQYLATYLPTLKTQVAAIKDADKRAAAQAIMVELEEKVAYIQKIADGPGSDRVKFKGIESELRQAGKLLNKIPVETGGAVQSGLPPSHVDFEERSWGSRIACSVVAADILSAIPGNTRGSPPDEDGPWGDLRRKHPSLLRGHMLNKHLHGPGEARNLAPITGALNDKMSATFEEYLKAEILEKRQVYAYQAKVTYGASPVGEDYTATELAMLPKQIDVQFFPLAKQDGKSGKDAADWKQAGAATQRSFAHELVALKDEKGRGNQAVARLVDKLIDNPDLEVKGKRAEKAKEIAKGQKKISAFFGAAKQAAAPPTSASASGSAGGAGDGAMHDDDEEHDDASGNEE